MHIGRSYRVSEFLIWTRRSIYWLLLIGTVPTFLYEVVGWTWLSVPWAVVALLGTATAFIVGFKNVQTYNRTWEARQIWGGAMSASRSWAIMCRDYIKDPNKSRELIYRHFAWLTALRYQLRAEKSWESTQRVHNIEYRNFYSIPEREIPIEVELSKYISAVEMEQILPANNKAIQLLAVQSAMLRSLYEDGTLENFRFMSMHEMLRSFSDHQGKSERIKNFPYPRQYATVNSIFIRLFCLLLPLGLLGEFNKLGNQFDDAVRGNLVWLVIPFSVLISWIYTSLEQVGESTENPFEGNSNDVPISQMSRNVEIDIRQMLGETEVPPVLEARNNIVL